MFYNTKIAHMCKNLCRGREMGKGEQAQTGVWYAVQDAKLLPIAMPIREAARLCGIEVGTAYSLSRADWLPFVRTYGRNKRGILVLTGPLLAWLGLDKSGKE
jgi:hypothetical protein